MPGSSGFINNPVKPITRNSFSKYYMDKSNLSLIYHKVIAVFILGLITPFVYATNQPPSVLLIIADDLTYSDMPVYGGINVATPNMDQLADEGMVFDRAYISTSMCVPSRSTLYTGMYPFRNGSAWNHSPTRKGTQSVVHRLTELGYRVGLAGKKHVYPDEVFPFEDVPGVDGRSVSDENPFNPDGIREFINRDNSEPFFLVIASTLPHVPWTHGEPVHFNKDELELPPYFVDTPQTRESYAKYLAEIEFLDKRLGIWLELLEESGQAENTLVFFTSEQGAQWPGAKWTIWAEGVKTGLIARWPGKIQPGNRTEAIVQYEDILPTLIDMAEGKPKIHDFDGESFLPVLLSKKSDHREFAFFMHNNVPEGPPYSSRGITDGKYHYIKNLQPEKLYIQKYIMGRSNRNPYWETWLFSSAVNISSNSKVERYMMRPKEELYDFENDRYQLDNLIESRDHQKHLIRLNNALMNWMNEQGDPGKDLDTIEAYEAAQRGEHFALPDQ